VETVDCSTSSSSAWSSTTLSLNSDATDDRHGASSVTILSDLQRDSAAQHGSAP
jgi:hypothetical protein